MSEGARDPFWEKKSLCEMSGAEWESLCDGCGRCCLQKIEDTETGNRYLTGVACRLLDIETCRCMDYEHRHSRVPDCVLLSPENVGTLRWLPSSCAYRRLAEGRSLPAWHPLVTGDPDSTRRAGMSVRNIAVSEHDVKRIEDHIIALLVP